jgi:hypothetical protein
MRALIAGGAGFLPAPGQHRAGRGRGQGRRQALTGGVCKEPVTWFRCAVPPRVAAMVRNALGFEW